MCMCVYISYLFDIIIINNISTIICRLIVNVNSSIRPRINEQMYQQMCFFFFLLLFLFFYFLFLFHLRKRLFNLSERTIKYYTNVHCAINCPDLYEKSPHVSLSFILLFFFLFTFSFCFHSFSSILFFSPNYVGKVERSILSDFCARWTSRTYAETFNISGLINERYSAEKYSANALYTFDS